MEKNFPHAAEGGEERVDGLAFSLPRTWPWEHATAEYLLTILKVSRCWAYM